MKKLTISCAGLCVGIALAFLLGSCKSKEKKKTGPDKNIEALKKDSSKLSDQARNLLSRRGNLGRERAQLRQKRKALEKKRASLAEDDVAGRAKLKKEEEELNKLEKKLAAKQNALNDKLLAQLRRGEQFIKRATTVLNSRAGSGGDPTANVRGRERGVASRERALAKREADVGKREKKLNEAWAKVNALREKKCAAGGGPVFTTVRVPAGAPSGGGGISKSAAKGSLGKVYGMMSRKGIRGSDLPGLSRSISNIKKYIRGKEYARAKYGADSVYSTLKGIKVNRGFVGSKMARLSGVIRRKKLTGSTRDKVNKLFVQVTTAYNDGRFSTANRKINRIYSLIR